jgi:hypothetical protein
MKPAITTLLAVLTTAAGCLASPAVRVFGREDTGAWPPAPLGREAAEAAKFAASETEECGRGPRVLAAVSGSFTAPGMREKIFTVETGECGAAPVGFGSRRLVLTRDGKPVASVETGGEVLKKFDVDKDGRDEFLLSWGSCEPGACRRWADVARFGDGVEVLSRLGVVYRSDCRAGGGVRVKEVDAASSGGRLVIRESRIDEPCSTNR